EPGGGVAEDAAEAVDDVLQLLLLIRLEERRTLERSQPGADADRLQVVDERLRVPGGRGVAPEVAGVEAARIPGLGQEPAGRGRIVGIRGRRPEELEDDGADGTGDARASETLGTCIGLVADDGV